jgi:hypothetical protein
MSWVAKRREGDYLPENLVIGGENASKQKETSGIASTVPVTMPFILIFSVASIVCAGSDKRLRFLNNCRNA